MAVCLILLAACGPQLGSADVEQNGPAAPAEDALPCAMNVEGTCIVSTSACDPQNVFVTAENTTCSACEGDEGERLICGEINEALCFDLESPSGGACQRCITVEGDVLYDDCSVEFVAAAQACEEVQRANAEALRFGVLPCENDSDCTDAQSCFFQSGTDGGVCVADDDLMLCSVCRDDDGNVLEESCRPQADTCSQMVDEQGQDCTECFRDGESIWRECRTPDLEPDRCVEYSNEVGRCVDCYGAAGEMLSHRCTISAESPTLGNDDAPADGEGSVASPVEIGSASTEFCDSYPLPGGITCTACYDEEGNLLSENCAESDPDLRCEELRFSEQTCTVCIDGSGNAQFTACTPNHCDDIDGDCGTPPACEVRVSGDNGYCRICPVGSAGLSETRCLAGGDLICRFEDDFDDTAPVVGPEDPSAAPAIRVCTVCSVEAGAHSEEVYRRCGDNVEAPLCLHYSQGDGECEVCFDTETQAELYSTCSWSLSPFQLSAGVEGVCSPLVAQTLTNHAGAPVWGPSGTPGEQPPVAVDCTSCELEPGIESGTFAACRVRAGHCDEAQSPGPAPVICTAQIQTYEYSTTHCTRPWGTATADDGVRQMIAWLIDTHDVTVWNGSVLEQNDISSCATAGRFQVEAAVRDAATLEALGFVATP